MKRQTKVRVELDVTPEEKRDGDAVRSRVYQLRNRAETHRQKIADIEGEIRDYLARVGWTDTESFGLCPTPRARCKGGSGTAP